MCAGEGAQGREGCVPVACARQYAAYPSRRPSTHQRTLRQRAMSASGAASASDPAARNMPTRAFRVSFAVCSETLVEGPDGVGSRWYPKTSFSFPCCSIFLPPSTAVVSTQQQPEMTTVGALIVERAWRRSSSIPMPFWSRTNVVGELGGSAESRVRRGASSSGVVVMSEMHLNAQMMYV